MTYVERLAGVAYFTLIIYCVASTGQYIAAKMGYGLDDSDPPFGRSGLSIYTDHLTGCQYLSLRGNLYARWDADGEGIIGCRERKTLLAPAEPKPKKWEEDL